MKKIVLLMLCAVPSVYAEDVEIILHEQLDTQRKKEHRNTTLSDVARIVAGSTCLVAAWVFYREARKEWIGLNDATLMERSVARIKEMPFFKKLRATIASEQLGAADESKFNLLAQEKAALSSKIDIAENVVLATGFTYFGFNLLAKGLHIIK